MPISINHVPSKSLGIFLPQAAVVVEFLVPATAVAVVVAEVVAEVVAVVVAEVVAVVVAVVAADDVEREPTCCASLHVNSNCTLSNKSMSQKLRRWCALRNRLSGILTSKRYVSISFMT